MTQLKAVTVYCGSICLNIACSVVVRDLHQITLQAWQKGSVFRLQRIAVDNAIKQKCSSARAIDIIDLSCCSVCVLCPAPVFAA